MIRYLCSMSMVIKNVIYNIIKKYFQTFKIINWKVSLWKKVQLYKRCHRSFANLWTNTVPGLQWTKTIAVGVCCTWDWHTPVDGIAGNRMTENKVWNEKKQNEPFGEIVDECFHVTVPPFNSAHTFALNSKVSQYDDDSAAVSN